MWRTETALARVSAALTLLLAISTRGVSDSSLNPGFALAGFGEGTTPSPPWRLDLLPDRKIPPTQFVLRDIDGRRALEISADASFGNYTHPFPQSARPGRLSWTWRVGRFAGGADLLRKRGDDNAIKVCALFDLPIERVPWFERFLLKQARKRTKKRLPAATVCYVWDSTLPIGTKVHNPFSNRLRYLVLRSGSADGDMWFDESRDLARDFDDSFGRESGGTIPPLLGIAIGADSDNTKGKSLAWISGVTHKPIDAPQTK